MHLNLTHIEHFLIKHFFENLIANCGKYSSVRWPTALKHLIISFLFKKAYKHVFNFNHRSSYCFHLVVIINHKHVLKCLTGKGMRLLTLLQLILCFCVAVASWQAELCVPTADASCDALCSIHAKARLRS